MLLQYKEAKKKNKKNKLEQTVMYNDVDDDDMEFDSAEDEEKTDNLLMQSSKYMISSAQISLMQTQMKLVGSKRNTLKMEKAKT